MKRKIVLRQIVALIMTVSLILTWSTPVAAAATMSDIRVGLTNFYGNKSTLKFSTNYIGMGYSINDRYQCETTFKSAGGFTFQVANGNFFVLDQSFKTYKEALAMAKTIESLGVKAYPASIYRETWKVYIGGEATEDAMNQIKKKLGTKYSYQGPYKDNGHRIFMIGDQTTIILDGKTRSAYPQFKSMNKDSNQVSTLNLGARQYRGRIEIGRYGKSTLTAVNIINIESYLYSVVPSEMLSSWPTESLKAQAVCARSYALTKAKYGTDSNITSGYILNDTTTSQVYKGYGAEAAATTRAVNATRGDVVTYQGDLICAYFFSTSGGRTESASKVWGMNVPYLVSVVDEYETEPEKAPWVVSLKKTDVMNKLVTAGLSVGNINKITTQLASVSNRIYTLEIIGDNQTQTLQSERIRNVLGLYSTKFKVETSKDATDTVVALSSSGKTNIELSDSYALSANGKTALGKTNNNIYIVKSSDNLTPFIKNGPTSDDVYYFVGLGYGHGVGLSQSGAKGLAKKGYTYTEIIQYYYKGCKVKKI